MNDGAILSQWLHTYEMDAQTLASILAAVSRTFPDFVIYTSIDTDIVLIARKRANDDVLRRALAPLVDAIPLALMQEANYRVDRERDKETPAATARWLESEIAARGN